MLSLTRRVSFRFTRPGDGRASESSCGHPHARFLSVKSECIFIRVAGIRIILCAGWGHKEFTLCRCPIIAFLTDYAPTFPFSVHGGVSSRLLETGGAYRHR